MNDLAAVRAWYAQELHSAAAVKSQAIVQAFAAVPRERFLGPEPGPEPWQICTADAPNTYWSTEDDNPRFVYHNVVIGMSNAKWIDAAVRQGDTGAVRSLRREAHEEDATCRLHADGWCLSQQAV